MKESDIIAIGIITIYEEKRPMTRDEIADIRSTMARLDYFGEYTPVSVSILGSGTWKEQVQVMCRCYQIAVYLEGGHKRAAFELMMAKGVHYPDDEIEQFIAAIKPRLVRDQRAERVECHPRIW